jgi:hypothetical protein
LRLLYRTSKEGYEFYSVQCKDCHHELKFSKTLKDETLYPKGWVEPYNGGSARSEETETEAEKPAAKPAGKPKDRIAF